MLLVILIFNPNFIIVLVYHFYTPFIFYFSLLLVLLPKARLTLIDFYVSVLIGNSTLMLDLAWTNTLWGPPPVYFVNIGQILLCNNSLYLNLCLFTLVLFITCSLMLRYLCCRFLVEMSFKNSAFVWFTNNLGVTKFLNNITSLEIKKNIIWE